MVLLGFQGNPEGPIATVQSQRAVQEENNELLSENLDRRRQQLFRQDMGSRLKSKIYTSAIASVYLHVNGVRAAPKKKHFSPSAYPLG